MTLYPLYFLLSLVAIPSLIIVAETCIKAFVVATAGMFGLEIEIEIESAKFISDLLS